MNTDTCTDAFEAQRSRLLGLAYRMLGSRAEAEDAVQDAWLRWRVAADDDIGDLRGYLVRIVTRLCLDRLKSARARREHYVGPWLPEPWVEDTVRAADPQSVSELADDLSFAFMLALERLTPAERAAFLLHDVFDLDFKLIAAALGRSTAACRQLATRARAQVRAGPTRFKVSPEQGERMAAAFLAAVASGNPQTIAELLAENARLLSDGGRRVPAIGIPVLGRERVARVLAGLARKHPPPAGARLRAARINCLPGYVITAADGSAIQTIAIEAAGDNQVAAIYIVRNPDKLRNLT